ncbi:L,D-transpeptidase family protein [Paenirhodobacter sp.]|jgi:murein L,D-transpeptidase YafK|uniref:L,D-transpeptidase family protein n=1 Tax=Paenirhodobacter sp. TaxID=1965326 RepID=UPI003B502E48
MQRRTLLAGLSGLTLLASCGGDSARFLPYTGPKITQVQVYKSRRKMYLISGNTVIKEYDVALGGNPHGKKRFEGDGKTPEGLYFIDRHNPRSAYHLSVGISYPNPQDVAYAQANNRKPGGDIFIHGRAGKDRGRGKDWTAGCIAVTDEEIEDIYKMITVGTPIWIFP